MWTVSWNCQSTVQILASINIIIIAKVKCILWGQLTSMSTELIHESANGPQWPPYKNPRAL